MCEDCGGHGDGGGHAHGHDHQHDHGQGTGHHGHRHAHDHQHGDGTGHARDHQHGDGTGHARDHQHDHVHLADDRPGAIAGDGTVRLAVTGKGGVGKTTLSAAIARHLAAHLAVVAVDADPDMNLAGALGVDAPPPITEERELIEERAGGAGLVNLTPAVRDVLDSHSTPFGDAGRLVTIGAPTAANAGCMCPENSVVRSLVSTALGEDVVVMDMEAGVEHLGRGTADSVDAMLVVVEPSQASIDTATRIHDLAADLGIERVRAVVNKARGNADVVAERLPMPVLTTLEYDESVATAAIEGRPPVLESRALQTAAAEVIAALAAPEDEVPAEA
jgi:CO dehydrogenase maturation factor